MYYILLYFLAYLLNNNLRIINTEIYINKLLMANENISVSEYIKLADNLHSLQMNRYRIIIQEPLE